MTVGHDPGLAATPAVWHTLKVERDGTRARLLALLVALVAGCDKEPRHEAPRAPVADAGRRAPEPVVADAAVDAAALDAAAPPTPLARVKLPRFGMCDRGLWCAPRAQAVELASPSAKDFQGCPSQLLVKKQFRMSIDHTRTRARQDAGKPECCYAFAVPCPPVGIKVGMR